jgi:acyl carrier protein phosphodiesterase
MFAPHLLPHLLPHFLVEHWGTVLRSLPTFNWSCKAFRPGAFSSRFNAPARFVANLIILSLDWCKLTTHFSDWKLPCGNGWKHCILTKTLSTSLRPAFPLLQFASSRQSQFLTLIF